MIQSKEDHRQCKRCGAGMRKTTTVVNGKTYPAWRCGPCQAKWQDRYRKRKAKQAFITRRDEDIAEFSVSDVVQSKINVERIIARNRRYLREEDDPVESLNIVYRIGQLTQIKKDLARVAAMV